MVIRVEEPKYTEQELCETVFYLSRYAECLEIDKTITVPDERELFWMLYDWAKQFEETFDPDGPIDHHEKLETEGLPFGQGSWHGGRYNASSAFRR